MTNNIEVLQGRLKSKKEAYKKRQSYLQFTVESEADSDTFESNAIGELTTMLQLKSEIRELEFALLILLKECTNCKWSDSSKTCNSCVDYNKFESASE